MQPRTIASFDRKTFNRIKRSIKNISKAKRQRNNNPRYATPVPEEIGIQLTYRCNLRCKHCFQWNKQGFFHDFYKNTQNTEIDTFIIEKILLETQNAKSNLYLWGGEPLLHHEWDIIAKLLEKDIRWTVLCTNGLLLEERMESILRISSNLALLVSLDGFQEENDAIRGRGTFNQIMKNLNFLLYLQKKGEYKGKISLSCVLNEKITSRLFEFLEYCETLEIDTLYFCFPWYISNKTANHMDKYFKKYFPYQSSFNNREKPSWYAYTYHLDLNSIKNLRSQIERLNSHVSKIRIRFQPALELNEIENFLLGEKLTAQKRNHCLAISNRMDVLANGKVTTCKNFPEFTVGDLNKQKVIEIWRSKQFNKIREVINSGLMPICSKCVLLYLNGI